MLRGITVVRIHAEGLQGQTPPVVCVCVIEWDVSLTVYYVVRKHRLWNKFQCTVTYCLGYRWVSHHSQLKVYYWIYCWFVRLPSVAVWRSNLSNFGFPGPIFTNQHSLVDDGIPSKLTTSSRCLIWEVRIIITTGWLTRRASHLISPLRLLLWGYYHADISLKAPPLLRRLYYLIRVQFNMSKKGKKECVLTWWMFHGPVKLLPPAEIRKIFFPSWCLIGITKTQTHCTVSLSGENVKQLTTRQIKWRDAVMLPLFGICNN